MLFYKTSEFAYKIGVSASTVRNWEKEGIIKPHHKSPNGYRYYSEEQVQQYFNGEFNKVTTDENKVQLNGG